MSRIILIGGGVGPMASLELHRLILQNTKASKDQDHLRIIHLSCPDMIGDRTEALLAGLPEKPAQAMANIITAGARAAEHLTSSCVVGIPCNTFHAPPIWNEFTQALASKGFTHPVFNMVEETISHIRKNYKDSSKIGILSTTGARTLGIYSKPLKACGFHVLEAENQELTHDLIYHRDWGIKANANITSRARNALYEQISELESRGAKAIILGCTELPLAVEQEKKTQDCCPLLDPMDILAVRLIGKVC